MKPSTMNAEQMKEIAVLHGDLEGRLDLEATLDTLVAEPIFEFHPPGGRLSGGTTLRRYYEGFFRDFMPRVRDARLIGEWASPECYVVENQIFVEVDGRVEPHQLIASMYGSGDKLGGERLYGSTTLIDLMLGDFKRELEAIEGVSPWVKG